MGLKEAVNKQTAQAHIGVAKDSVKKAIKRSPPKENQHCTFSFRFFEERENFGLKSNGNSISNRWMLSFIERLGELSKLMVDQLFEKKENAGTLRVHNINWEQRNIPIKRPELTSIDKEYLENSEEFPILQIAVSKALGRIIGFFDEDNCFQIVLLDPLHNAQPSKDNDYKVRLCRPLGCEVTSIRYEAKKAIKKIEDRSCSCAKDLIGSLEWTKSNPGFAIVVPSENKEMIDHAEELIESGLAESYEHLINLGINKIIEE